MWGSVKRSVLGPHTLTHFPTPNLFLSPHPSPSRQHTSPLTPHTFPHPFPHFSTPHTSFLTHLYTPTLFPTQYTSPHIPHTCSVFPQLPSPPPTPQHTSPLTPCTLPHLYPHLPHSLDYVAKLPCDKLTLNLTGLWKSPIKFSTTRNLKSCFGVDNVNFRCMTVWQSYHVAKLLATKLFTSRIA